MTIARLLTIAAFVGAFIVGPWCAFDLIENAATPQKALAMLFVSMYYVALAIILAIVGKGK